MQTDVDMEVLVESIQAAAMRRGLFVGYMPAFERWTVTNPHTTEIVGGDKRLEKIFDVLDNWEPVIASVEDIELRMYAAEGAPAPRRRV
ncbi:MAG: hypothetical protein OXG44_01535 [Gammaproteobacteria bacterium]|nr:hypothetical protein [Gammaproteobacteria bacterium]